MSRRVYVLLFLTGLIVISAVACFQQAPGYVDAEYYYAGGLRLAGGHGFSELVLWSYLDDPAGLPHPSHAYWMPLASMLAALGMRLSGLFNFYGARLGFILAAACVPPLTASLAHSLTGSRFQAILAGLLAAIPPFYLSYLGTTDNFGLYMLLGAVWFQVAGSKRLQVTGCRLQVAGSNLQPSTCNLQPLLLGLIAGLMHLSRTDGVLWLFMSLIAAGLLHRAAHGQRSNNLSSASPHAPQLTGYALRFTPSISRLPLALLGYFLVMGPWMLRNLTAFGVPLAPGGARALWLTRYDDLYSYPASLLTPQRWWASGLGSILQARLDALWQNLQNAFAVQGEIFLAPLILLGLRRLRADLRVRLGVLAWLLTIGLMSLVFPHQGWRGGFFHSGAALQPLFWTAAAAGLEVFTAWGARIRGWHAAQAGRFFGAGLVGLALLLALLVVPGRVIGPSLAEPRWNAGQVEYARLEGVLQQAGAGPGEVVAVNNASGYFAAAGRPAISIPDGDESTLLAAARRYGASYILLEYNHPRGLDDLYRDPAGSPGLNYLLTLNETHIFRVE